MEIYYNTHIHETSFAKVQISYPDLMYAAQNLTPTSFKIYLYIIGHPERTVTREELVNYFGIDNGQLYKSRKEMSKFGFGSMSENTDYTYYVYNTCWGEDKEYIPNW